MVKHITKNNISELTHDITKLCNLLVESETAINSAKKLIPKNKSFNLLSDKILKKLTQRYKQMYKEKNYKQLYN